MNAERRTKLEIIARFLRIADELLDEIALEEQAVHDNTGHLDKLDNNIALQDASIALATACEAVELIASGGPPGLVAARMNRPSARGPATSAQLRFCPKCKTARGAGTTRCWAKGCGDETPFSQCPTG